MTSKYFERQKREDMASFLMYRYFFSGRSAYSDLRPPQLVDLNFKRMPVKDSNDLLKALKEQIEKATSDGKAAIALSGGIDSAILAKFMPKGSKAYTFRCVVPDKVVTDESQQAAKYAALCGLKHEVIDITWEDIVSATDDIILYKGAPLHSIEAQIYIAGCKAKLDGFERMIFGENADIIYGGMDGLLAKDWFTGEFIDRYSYCQPSHIMWEPECDFAPFYEFSRDGHIDGYDFTNKYFRQEALGTYTNACKTAGIEFVGPYSKTKFTAPIDYRRIRSGDTKYVVREAFMQLYPDCHVPKKVPMPRPMNEWMASWKGPNRPEFIPNCIETLSGDQRWMVWILERYLNVMDRRRNIGK